MNWFSKENRGVRYNFVVVDNFSKLGWTVTLKNTNAQSLQDSIEPIVLKSNRKLKMIETVVEKEFADIFLLFS